jgi:hypothetical protein
MDDATWKGSAKCLLVTCGRAWLAGAAGTRADNAREVNEPMFDMLRNQYELRCPESGGETVWVSISSFRLIRRLRGATSPAIFRVVFDCSCGGRHEALLAHDTLDYEPIVGDLLASTQTFTNLLTGTRELVGFEFGEAAGRHIRAGRWPWTFWCHPESSARPAFPSALRMLTPLGDQHATAPDAPIGALVRCSSCQRLTVNLVTRRHIDEPFYNDATIRFVDRLLPGEHVTDEELFRHQLHGCLASVDLPRAS